MTIPDRRDFLKQTSSAALALSLASPLARGADAAPSDRIAVAVIGVKGQGGNLLRNFAAQSDVEVTHIVDIDDTIRAQRVAETRKQTGREPSSVRDYRTLLDNPAIDALVIGTPDHWHALPTIHACQHGKDVYVEKPDGHNIFEGRMMVAAARKYGRVVQMGTQTRSATFLAEASEYIAAGNLGKVIFGRAWETAKQSAVTALPDAAPPQGVDYNLWLGAAAERPFNPRRFHGSWRWFFDLGCGDLGNDGVHRLDYARKALGITTLPTAVSCAGGKFFFDDVQEWPDTMQVTYEYPGQILVYELRIWSGPRHLNLTEGAEVIGDNGRVLITNNDWKAFDAKGKVVRESSDNGALTRHIRNFLDCVKSRRWQDLNQEIASGHVSSFLCHAGNIAWRTGKKLHVDAASETFDDAAANRLVRREYRSGFEVPAEV